MILPQNKKFLEKMLEELSTMNGRWLDDFNNLEYVEKEYILNEIIMTEGKLFRECMINKKDVTLPCIGSFKITKEMLYAKELKAKILKKYGYNSYKECPKYFRKTIKAEFEQSIRDSSKEYRKSKAELKNIKPEVIKHINNFNNIRYEQV